MVMTIPAVRVKDLNGKGCNAANDYILYWMTAARRTRDNFALQAAVKLSLQYKKPILVFEALRFDHEWASDRLSAFVLDGMRANAQSFAKHGITYFPYREPTKGAGRGLLESLAAKAVAVVTDGFPSYFIDRMTTSVADRLDTSVFRVDSNGICPLDEVEKTFLTAYSFRRYLQKNLVTFLGQLPMAQSLEAYTCDEAAQIPEHVPSRWKPLELSMSRAEMLKMLGSSGYRHQLGFVDDIGGEDEAQSRWHRFLTDRLGRYSDDRNHPTKIGTSRLSAYLHFGHISTSTMVRDMLAAHGWTADQASSTAKGSREGWWNLPSATEAFLDQVITWRELGYIFCHRNPNTYNQYAGLPEWALKTLDDHASDTREFVYSLDQLDHAKTHDELWNAAQTQLREEGYIHNYMRMLWGKKILEWTPSPEHAFEILVELNNRYAIDGRNPNSWSGLCWTLGRFDRPWGPERKVFGKIRFMSSLNTAKKLPVKDYLAQYGGRGTQAQLFSAR
ncbi:MAG: deoxyribodipyrimidine photo-lyase [Bradymonadia bacterium]